MGTIRLGGANVMDGRALVECVAASSRTVHILIAYDEIRRLDVRLKTSCGTGADEKSDSERMERPDVGAVVDLMRRN
jgi:hypothetical protein